jgi:hypothetical protein
VPHTELSPLRSKDLAVNRRALEPHLYWACPEWIGLAWNVFIKPESSGLERARRCVVDSLKALHLNRPIKRSGPFLLRCATQYRLKYCARNARDRIHYEEEYLRGTTDSKPASQ